MITAILGGKITVPTIDGDVEMSVTPGTQPGERKALRKRGLQRFVGRQGKSKDDRGDQWVTLRVDIPTSLTAKQKAGLLEVFGNSSNANEKPKEESCFTKSSSTESGEPEEDKKGFFSSVFGSSKKKATKTN